VTEREIFITNFVANWMSTYTALHYDEDCANSRHEQIEAFNCVDDAIYLAELAWKRYEEAK
jgi:hypothetical protein